MSEMDAQEHGARIDQHLADIELKLEQARQLRGVNYDVDFNSYAMSHGSLSSLASELRAHGARSWSRCFTGAEMIYSTPNSSG